MCVLVGFSYSQDYFPHQHRFIPQREDKRLENEKQKTIEKKMIPCMYLSQGDKICMGVLFFFCHGFCSINHTIFCIKKNVPQPIFFSKTFQIGEQPFGTPGTFWPFHFDMTLVLVQQKNNSLRFLSKHRKFTLSRKSLCSQLVNPEISSLIPSLRFINIQ